MKFLLRSSFWLLAFLICFSQSFAQSLRVVNNVPVVRGTPNTDVVTRIGDVTVTNTSNRNVHVLIQKTFLPGYQKFSNSLCFGAQCYGADSLPTCTSRFGDTIRVGASNTTFTADFYPNGMEGTTRIKYCFLVNGSTSDSTCTIITYSNVTSTKNRLGSNALVASPNPCTDVLNLSFAPQDEASRIDLYNLLGQKMLSHNIAPSASSTSIRTADLPTGQYFVRFMMGNKSLATTRVSVR